MLEQKKRNWKLTMGLAAVLFALVMARYCAFGMQYYPQLDDYIQYHNYPSSGDFMALQQSTGLLASRPLAGIADFFVWGPMFDNMIVGVALISAMYVAAVLLVWNILGRYFRISPMLPVIMALLPLGIEGTYWMSASTRVVVGMFFAALAARTFLNWLDGKGWGWLLLYIFLQLLPFGFYEQAGLLSITLTVGAAILEWTRKGKPLGRCALSLWGVAAMGLYFLFTKLMADGGVYGSRAEILLPFSRYYWFSFLPRVLWQFFRAYLGGGFFTAAKGFVRGVRMIFSGELLLWALGTAALCALLCLLFKRSRPAEGERKDPPIWLTLLSGVLLAAGPASLFLVLGNPWFSLRGTVTSFPGIALLADTILLWIVDRSSFKQSGPAVLAAAMAFVFCVAGASDISDYRDTYENDQRIAKLVLDTLEEEGLDASSGRIGVLNLEASYLPNQNFFYHEHIHGCTESDWAFQGLLGCVGQGRALPAVTPLPTHPVYWAWNAATSRPETFDVLYYYDGTSLARAELRPWGQGEHDFEVYRQDGGILGHIWEEKDQLGYFEPVSEAS